MCRQHPLLACGTPSDGNTTQHWGGGGWKRPRGGTHERGTGEAGAANHGASSQRGHGQCANCSHSAPHNVAMPGTSTHNHGTITSNTHKRWRRGRSKQQQPRHRQRGGTPRQLPARVKIHQPPGARALRTYRELGDTSSHSTLTRVRRPSAEQRTARVQLWSREYCWPSRCVRASQRPSSHAPEGAVRKMNLFGINVAVQYP